MRHTVEQTEQTLAARLLTSQSSNMRAKIINTFSNKFRQSYQREFRPVMCLVKSSAKEDEYELREEQLVSKTPF
jgi:hypothetical protein